MFLVKAACKAKHTIGATDNIRMVAVKVICRVGDLRVPLTRPMGLHANRPDNTQTLIL